MECPNTKNRKKINLSSIFYHVRHYSTFICEKIEMGKNIAIIGKDEERIIIK
jgi:hypothetical protein